MIYGLVGHFRPISPFLTLGKNGLVCPLAYGIHGHVQDGCQDHQVVNGWHDEFFVKTSPIRGSTG